MGTVDKVLRVLRLFSAEDPQWTVESAALNLGIPSSTAYRYFRSLTEFGLIADFAGGRYVIGPATIEQDRLARRTDPLVLAARAPMDELASVSHSDNIVLLSRIYGRRVMCVDQRSTGHHHMALSFERGRPMPLFRSSVSKVILANLSPRTLARIHQEDQEEIERAGLGKTLKEFRRYLRDIRRDGFFISHGEVDAGVVGIAAPVMAPGGDVLASIALVLPEGSADQSGIDALIPRVIQAAALISTSLRHLSIGPQAGGAFAMSSQDRAGAAKLDQTCPLASKDEDAKPVMKGRSRKRTAEI